VLLLGKAVAAEAAKILGIASGEQIALDVPLSQYGLDSLTAVEMKNWTEKQVKVDIPVVDFVRGPPSEQLARSMLAKYYEKFGRPAAAGAPAAGPAAEAAPAAAPAAPSAADEAAAAASLEQLQTMARKEKRRRPLTAYVFAGQSDLKPGVGMDLYERYPQAKVIWDQCDAYFMEELGLSLLKIVRENPREYKIDFTAGAEGARLRQKYITMRVAPDDSALKEIDDPNVSARAFPSVREDTDCYVFTSPNGLLKMTHFAQPVIVVYEYVALACLAQGSDPTAADSAAAWKTGRANRHFFCGHSLGEYCALTALGNIAPAHEMAMVCFIRGMVMQSCVPRDPITQITDYGMAAVSPMRVAPWFKIEHLRQAMECVVNACGGRLLQIVNYNVYNDQYVVSGERYTIWQLSHALTYLQTNGKEALKDLDTFCYQAIATYPYSTTPLEIPRSTAVMQLKGIDIPFHSRQLRKVVPLFRSFLDSRLPSAENYDYAGILPNRFITNVYSKEPFSLALPYVRKILAVTGSPVLRAALGPLADGDVTELVLEQQLTSAASSSSSSSAASVPAWLTFSPNQRARLLLRESLSFQFASPVQWVDAQNTLIRLGARRVVEIGPLKILGTMFSKTLLRLAEQGPAAAALAEAARARPIEVLSFGNEKDVLLRLSDEEED
jgi:malonyl CoA-acyl carrier protein transacylase